MVAPLSSEGRILEVIHKLPLLESIHFDFEQPGAPGGSNSPFPIVHGLSNLKSIVLTRPQARCIPNGRERQPWNLVPDGIHSLLASSPLLENLSISGVVRPMDFSDIVKELPDQPRFEACIKSLQLRDMTLSPSPATLQYLYNLQCLDISNVADEGIWNGLRFFGTRLKVIKISQVTNEVVKYILDYQGLEEFYLTARCRGSKPYPDRRRLLESALPNHRNSLYAFGVRLHCTHHKENIDLAKLWCLDEDQIACLRTLPRLNKLEVTFLSDRMGSGALISLVRNFGSSSLFLFLMPCSSRMMAWARSSACPIKSGQSTLTPSSCPVARMP